MDSKKTSVMDSKKTSVMDSKKTSVMDSLFAPYIYNFGVSLCQNFFDHNTNLGTNFSPSLSTFSFCINP